uniref:26S proteasome non-ATPase regulatory subunit 9 n=1 Tax=Gopherus agassizii TaxID=38772 RepID=A0A452HRG7_9SAUR
ESVLKMKMCWVIIQDCYNMKYMTECGRNRAEDILFSSKEFRQKCLQNDHKALMLQVEKALHQLHAREKAKQAKDEAEAQAEAMNQNQSLPQPFARVNAVTPGSPASISGLQVDDEIIEFGSVDTHNFQTLQNIATVVQHSEGKPLSVTVIRGGKKLHLGLTPKHWAGKGLLG